MSNDAWRGERRLRVAVEVRERSARVSGMTLLDGPAVQKPSLEGPFLTQSLTDGALVLMQSFDDPLLERGVARPDGDLRHSFAQRDKGLIHVDVPLPASAVPSMTIRIFDASAAARSAVDPDATSAMLSASPRGARLVAEITSAELASHPDWNRLGLGTVPAETGRFEIYVDRAGEYRWRLRRPDGEIVADSGEGYPTRAACEADLQWIKQHAPTVPVVPLDIV